VDDNEMNIHVAEGLLDEYRIRVTPANSGAEALELIESKDYDMVFMDHMMPEMDGIETLRRIREKPGHYYRDVPVVILTANVVAGNRKMFLEEGFNDFLEKPIEISVLERVLKRNLPREKLIFKSEEKEVSQEEAQKAWEVQENDTLLIGDLDVEMGMLCCGGRNKYLEILRTYSQKGDIYRQQLEEFFDAKDWKNYTIKVHALKSMMQSIGAVKLSEMARALEQAGKKNDSAYLLANHAGMLLEYDKVMQELSQSEVLFPADGSEETTENASGLIEDKKKTMDEETFDSFLKELEEGGYALDRERMKHTLSELEIYEYGGIDLQDKLAPIRRKIEESDYMSAVDAMYQLRERIRKEQGGGQET
jgi:CheY-like chemotaxis protein